MSSTMTKKQKQKPIGDYWQPISAPNNIQDKENTQSNNQMGLQSQHRVPVNQKCREAAYSSRNHTTHPNNQPKGDDVQPKLVQVDLEMEKIPRCDEGTKVCPQCKYMAEHNCNDNHHIAHDPTSEGKIFQSRYFYRHQNNYSLHQGAMCSSHIYHPVANICTLSGRNSGD